MKSVTSMILIIMFNQLLVLNAVHTSKPSAQIQDSPTHGIVFELEGQTLGYGVYSVNSIEKKGTIICISPVEQGNYEELLEQMCSHLKDKENCDKIEYED